MTDIFLSYSSEDLARVKPLVDLLEARGWSVWWDKQLIAGPNYEDKIEEALDVARCVVVVWSRHSIESQWVRTEAREGLERRILVPLRIDDVKPPLAYRISQTASMIDWPDQEGELPSVLDGIADLVAEPSISEAVQSDPRPKTRETAARKRYNMAVPLTILAVITVAFSAAWYIYSSRTSHDGLAARNSISVEQASPIRSVKPSIAVLAFENMSNNPEQEYFSDGITVDIISRLSMNSMLLVISRSSSFTYKGKSVRIPEVSKELGVRYVLEGSVRQIGKRVRITAQLIEQIHWITAPSIRSQIGSRPVL